ncbi:AzlC family ABC transporter permease [Lacibacterium aquatile]|uniref:AzlC family ABC transporter permease n=1 Tax=Lacibacterium aquatile TaxID=1168082 RepID=A0ABW5DWX1_9PROT
MTYADSITSDPSFRSEFARGFLICLPIALSVAIFGIIYGLLAAQKGLSLVEAVGMCLIVFAGASQLLALELWSMPPTALTLAIAVFIINLRYLMQTATLGEVLKPWGRAGLLATLFNADENWAVTMTEHKKAPVGPGFFMGSAMALYSFWAGSAGIGWLAGGVAPDAEKYGLSFVGTAVFLFLLQGLAKKRSDLLPILVGAGAAIAAAKLIPGTWFILIGGLAGSLAGLARDLLKEKTYA